MNIFAITVLLSTFATCSQLVAQTSQRPNRKSARAELPAVQETKNTTALPTLSTTDNDVYIVTREQILAWGCQTLADVMRYVPGFLASKPYIADYGEGYRSRGYAGNEHILILRNGVPVTASALGYMPIGQNINLLGVQQIEFHFSSGTAQFGNGTQGGFINIVSFEGDQNDALLRAGLGSGGALRTEFSANKLFPIADKYLRVQVNGSLAHRDNWNAEDAFAEQFTAPGLGAMEQPFHRVLADMPSSGNTFGISLDFEGFAVEYHRLERKDNSSLGRHRRNTYYYNADASWGETAHILTGGYTYKSSSFTARALARLTRLQANTNSFYNLRLDTNDIIDPEVYRYAASEDLLLQADASWKVTDIFSVQGGVSMLSERGLLPTTLLSRPFIEKNYTIGERPSDAAFSPAFGFRNFGAHTYDIQTLNIFLTANASFKNVQLSASGRLVNHDTYGTQTSFRGGISYSMSRSMVLFANGGTTFHLTPYRYANTSVAVATFDNGLVARYFFVPNSFIPNNPHAISAETGYNAEIGIRTDLSNNLRLTGTIFANSRSGVAERIRILPLVVNQTFGSVNGNLLFPFSNPNNSDTAITYISNADNQISRYGIHLRLEAEQVLPNVGFMIATTYTAGEDTFFGSQQPYYVPTPGRDVVMNYDPALQIQAEIHWNITKELFVSGFISLYSEITPYRGAAAEIIPSAARLDLAAQYRLTSDLNLWVRTENLSGGAYSPLLPFGREYMSLMPQTGTLLTGGITYIID